MKRMILLTVLFAWIMAIYANAGCVGRNDAVGFYSQRILQQAIGAISADFGAGMSALIEMIDKGLAIPFAGQKVKVLQRNDYEVVIQLPNGDKVVTVTDFVVCN
jgi:hypothetical protein